MISKLINSNYTLGKNSFFLKTNIFKKFIAKFLRFNNCIMWYLLEMMVVKNDFFLKIYNTFYEHTINKIIEEEIKIADICKDDKVLHIGCGPFPITAMCLRKITGADVVTIDKRSLAVSLAKNYLKNKKIEGINIFCDSGESFPIKDYDVIVITSSVGPRQNVLENVFENSYNKCRVICRELSLVDKSTLEYIKNVDWYIDKKIDHKPDWSSYIVKRN